MIESLKKLNDVWIMEEHKLQALHDTLSILRGHKGLGANSVYSWQKNQAGKGPTLERTDGLPHNSLYVHFVKEGTYDPNAKVYDGDGRTIKRDFSDSSSRGNAAVGNSSDENDISKKSKEQRKAEKKAAAKAAKLAAKRQAKMEEKKKAKLLRKQSSMAAEPSEPTATSEMPSPKESKKQADQSKKLIRKESDQPKLHNRDIKDEKGKEEERKRKKEAKKSKRAVLVLSGTPTPLSTVKANAPKEPVTELCAKKDQKNKCKLSKGKVERLDQSEPKSVGKKKRKRVEEIAVQSAGEDSAPVKSSRKKKKEKAKEVL